MADEAEEKTRKTVSFTHRQLGVGTGLAGLLIAITPIKEWFFTREEGVAQSRQIAALQVQMDKSFTEQKIYFVQANEENVRRLERQTDKLMEHIKESEARASKAEDRLDRRMDTIEASMSKSRNRGI